MVKRVIVVTGAFATHTSKLYNYYVCPVSWDTQSVSYISVTYFNQLKYLGEVVSGPIEWKYSKNDNSITGFEASTLPPEVLNDLRKFRSLFKDGRHNLFLLKPIINNCCTDQNIEYSGRGAFTRSHRYFQTLGLFFENFLQSEHSQEIDDNSEASNVVDDED